MIEKIVEKSLNDKELSEKEIKDLFKVPVFSKQSSLLLWAARKKSAQVSNGFAEVHAQIGLNITPCPQNCLFCSFAARNKVFTDSFELSIDDAVFQARQFEAEKANAIYLMTTANYSFEKFIETSKEIRRALKRDTVLVANIGDFTLVQAQELKHVGFSGIYHAVRLGENHDTCILVEKRLETMRNAQEAGLLVGTCVEPVGIEHSIDELVEKTIITRDIKPVYSGAARRILIPGTKLAKYDIVSESKMALILAIVRLSLSSTVKGNCTHEPNVVGACAGANLLWAEVGSNPRDIIKDTEKKRGMSVQDCISILKEAEWSVLDGPSQLYATSL
ncbi:MAG: radical SAM protein [Candidatus Thermoplasmatota archaeon]|jgi:biotin synthase|nr:radical SAM protein [Candidatus Thermoplasmatota archaeon]